MEPTKIFNPTNATNVPLQDTWILNKRNAILEWFDEARLHASLDAVSDEDMCNLIVARLKELVTAEPSELWDNVVYEVAEGILELDDEWAMTHYEIEEYLLYNYRD
jgi:hypothetical protein